MTSPRKTGSPALLSIQEGITCACDESRLRCTGGKVQGLDIAKRVFPCATPAEVRDSLPEGVDVLAFQCRNPIHKAHYELFIRALEADNVGSDAVCLVHPTCGPTQVRPDPLTPTPLLGRALCCLLAASKSL